MRALFATALAFVLLSVPSEAQTIRVQHDRKVDFSEYLSFAWLEGTTAVDPEVNRIIQETIENELSIRGIFPDEAEPNLNVVYHASARETFEVQGGYQRDWEGSGAVTVESHLAGTLVIDLVDAGRNRVIWRATATATVSGSPKKARGRVPSVIQKMFVDFPPSAP